MGLTSVSPKENDIPQESLQFHFKTPFLERPGSISYPESLLKCDFRSSVFLHCSVEKNCDSQKNNSPFLLPKHFLKKTKPQIWNHLRIHTADNFTGGHGTNGEFISLAATDLVKFREGGGLEIPKRSVGGIIKQNRKNAV